MISYENQQFQWAAEDLIAGDISAVSEGNGVLTVFDKSNSLKVGDTIQLEQTELTVAGVLKDSPFDTSDQPTVICSEENVQGNYRQKMPMLFLTYSCPKKQQSRM